MNRSTRFLLSLAILPASLGSAQSKPTPAETRAALLHSLDNFRPGEPDDAWKLTAAVQLFDQGKPGETGTVDIVHASKNVTYVAYNFPSFHQVAVKNPQGRFRQGDLGDPPPGLIEFNRFLSQPADRTILNTADLKTFTRKTKGGELHCVHSLFEGSTPAVATQTFCSIGGSPAIRYAQLREQGYSVFLGQLAAFQGGEAPTSADVLFDSRPVAHFKLTFSPYTHADAAFFQPPANSIQIHSNVGTQAGRKLNAAYIYPTAGGGIDPSLTSNPAGFGPLDVFNLPDIPVLVRIEVDPSGKVIAARALASRDLWEANKFANGMIGKKTSAPTTSTARRFANYSLVTHTYISYPGDDFPAVGNNPAMVAAPPIADH